MARSIGAWLRSLVSWFRPRAIQSRAAARELRSMILLALIAGGVFAFIMIAHAVSEQETLAFDVKILKAMREPGDPDDPIGPFWLEEMGRDVTGLGGFAIIAMVTLGATLYFLVRQREWALELLTTAVVGGAALTGLLKLVFRRPEPALVPDEAFLYATSFPSGHAMVATILYPTLAFILTRRYRDPGTKLVLLGSAAIVSLLVGVSRVYLGVHWPTDVLAGWAGGVAWAAACWAVAIHYERPET
jgi:undecaprenyl-diphosphatase